MGNKANETIKEFHTTFFNDAVISPLDRKILLLEVHILEALGPYAFGVRPYLDTMTIPEVVELLDKCGAELRVAAKEKS